MASPQAQIVKEFKKAQDWYKKTYRKDIEIHERYDNKEKAFSWRLVARIGGQDRIIALGMTAKQAESDNFNRMRDEVLRYVQSALTKAQAKWEPMVLRSKQ